MQQDPSLARIIDGRACAAAVRAEVGARIERVIAQHGVRPTLAVVRVGHDPASEVYVRMKRRAAARVGIEAIEHHLPADASVGALEALIDRLNADDQIDGILVQMPLPPHIEARDMIARVDPAKDVDGLHPINLGGLCHGRAHLAPCTPLGVMALLEGEGVALAGMRAVVVGRSLLVGKPMALLLDHADCTVTLCHKHTRELREHVATAELLVVAAGSPELIRGDWVRPGAVIIDVGISRRPDGRLVGDVAFEAARRRAAAITPVPGGVGPMTVATLLRQTVRATEARRLGRFEPAFVPTSPRP